MKKNIIIIGAGQLGSRHLQALKKVDIPLSIQVVDPNSESLRMAKQRFEEIKSFKVKHDIQYLSSISSNSINIDLAIVATNSDVRSLVVENIFKKSRIKNLILEKLLFQKKKDYKNIANLTKKNECKTWVDCSMRTMPFCYDLKNKFEKQKINYVVTGSLFGLVTNAIHYLDHIVFLTGDTNFQINTSFLDNKIIPSKRKGFLEATGMLACKFKNGSLGLFNSHDKGDLPLTIDISSETCRCFIRWDEQKAFFSEEKNKWRWVSVPADLPLQSEMTTHIVEDILIQGSCLLPTYAESMKTHISLLDPLLKFVNKKIKKKINYYPFT